MVPKLKLLPNELNDSLNELMRSLFNANAVADNIVYQLENVFVMPKASELMHEKYAHAFPGIADTVNKIQILRGGRGTRKSVIASETEYATVNDCFIAMLDAVIDVDTQFWDSLDMCDDMDEKAVRIYIENTYLEILPFTKQTMLWIAKSEQFGDNLALFDAEFDDTMILGGA